MDGENTTGLRWLYVGALLMIVIGGSIDLVLDAPTSWLSFHVFFELLMVAGALLVATTFWLGWWRARQSVERLRERLEERRAERDAWKTSAERALLGLGQAIDEQFRAWGLTPAEREVALLLLKGHSHKAIARTTGRSERTARQHAAAVYQKARLSGRAELAAFFLEDLMLPAEPRNAAPAGHASDGPLGGTQRD